MIRKRRVFSFVLLAAWLSLGAHRAECQQLHVYGPDGPSAPLKECGGLFTARTHVEVVVTAGPEKQWLSAALGDGDIVYGGAEYMLTQFGLEHPGFLEDQTRTELYARAVAILVRKGNPKGIRRFADLTRPGVRLLDVNGAGQLGAWEDIAGREDLIASLQPHLAASVPNTAEALKLWQARPDLDAWITYASWGKRLPGQFSVVALAPGEVLYRGTPAAVTARSTEKPRASQFLAFLHSSECHAVFQRWGWR